jgi:hypothetical protein
MRRSYHNADAAAEVEQLKGLREALEQPSDAGVVIVDPRGRILDGSKLRTMPNHAEVIFNVLETLPGQWLRRWHYADSTLITFEQEKTVTIDPDRSGRSAAAGGSHRSGAGYDPFPDWYFGRARREHPSESTDTDPTRSRKGIRHTRPKHRS